MKPQRSDSGQLVMTEAEPVPSPDVTVPEPSSHAPTSPSQGALEPELLLQIKSLADRVGGLEKLRNVVDTLLKIR